MSDTIFSPDVLAAIRYATQGLRHAPPVAQRSPAPEGPTRPRPVAPAEQPPDIANAIHFSREASLRATAPPQRLEAAPAMPTPAPAQPVAPGRRKHSHGNSRPPAAAKGAISAPHERHLSGRRKAASKLLAFVPHDNQRRALDISDEEYEREELLSPGSVARRMLTSLSDNKGDLNAARTTLIPLIAYLKRHRVIASSSTTVPSSGPGGKALNIGDYCLDGFLNEISSTPSARKRRRVALQLLRDAAGFHFKLGRQCHKKLVVSGTRPKPKALKPAADPAMIYHLELLAGDRSHRPLIRISAAMAVAGAHICLRGIGSQRTGRLALSGSFLRGEVGADYKKGDETIILDRPFATPACGITGSAAWVEQLQLGLHGVEDGMFLIRETDSTDGDPRRATCFTNELMKDWRAINMLRGLMHVPALYSDGYHPCPSTAVPFDKLTFKHLRRYFPALARSVGESKPDRNEIGAWSGSQAERIDGGTLDEAALSASACADLYSTDGAEARAPYIMLRVATMARALQAGLHDRKCPKGFADLSRMHVMGRLPRPGVEPVRAQAAPAARPIAATAAESAPASRGKSRVAWHGPLRIAYRSSAAAQASSSTAPH